MNLLKNKFAGKLMLVAMMLLGATGIISADTIKPGDITVTKAGEAVIPVELITDGDAVGFQFDMVAPDGVEIVKVEKTNLRLTKSHKLSFTEGENRVLVYSFPPSRFTNNTGATLNVTVKVSPRVMLGTEPLEFKLENIKISDADRKELCTETKSSSKIVLGSDNQLTGAESLVVRPNQTTTVTVGLNNSSTVSGLQMDIELPEGFTFKMNDDGEFEPRVFDSRISDAYTIAGTPNGNKVFLLLFDMEGKAEFKENTGDIFAFDIIAPAAIPADAKIRLYNLRVTSNTTSESVKGGDWEIALVDGEALDAAIAKANADAAEVVKGLNDALAAALATIAEECPLVKDEESFNGEPVAAAIKAIEDAVKAENEAEDGDIVANYNKVVTEPAALVNEDIKKLVDGAKLAQAEAQAEIDRKNKNQAAYEADKQIIDELTKALEDVIAEIKDFDNVEDFDQDKLQIYREISNLNKAVESKFEDVAEKGEYKSQIASIDQAAIKGMIDSYKKKALNKENQRKADNQAAYDADLADIKTVEDSYNTVKNGIQSDWTNTFPEDQAAIDAAIDALKQKAGDELARVADNGTYVDQIDQNALDAVQAKINAYNEKLQTSGIGSIIADEDLQNVRIYTIDGVRHNSLVPGVNIIVKADGTTTKVYVK